MNVIICICSLLLVINLWILYKSVQNYKYINRKYIEFLVKMCLSNCCNGIFKENSFFYMQECKTNLSELTNDLEYVDYIGKSSLFI